jgi:UDP-N-acetylglucosamine 2-epimerase (non-hydrolysing)
VHHVAVFIGTRPEAIKCAPVVHALREHPDLEPIVVSTGQHSAMLRQALEPFGITPDEDLAVMRHNQTLAGLTARLMEGIDDALERLAPSFTLVQGDTTTTMVGALASFYRRIPVGHIEAGLRTGDVTQPFPEEVNRRIVSPVARLHFPPTERSANNLLAEGIDPATVLVTGNTVIDALHMEVGRQAAGDIGLSLDDELHGMIGEGFGQKPIVLITGHRRENFGSGFESMCGAIAGLAERFEDYLFVYPVHLNPNVKGPVHEMLGGLPNVRLIEPIGYSLFVRLMHASRIVLTDSGGVQEEAPGLGKPVLVMRNTTERPEGVDAGTVKLVGTDAGRITHEVSELIEDEAAYERMAQAKNPYGDGKASARIVDAIARVLSGEPIGQGASR